MVDLNHYESSNTFNFEEDYDYGEETVQNCDYIFVEQEEIFDKRTQKIEEVTEILGLSPSQAVLALIFFNWRVEAIRDVWWNDPLNPEKAGISQSKESLLAVEAEGGYPDSEECLICFEELEGNNVCLDCNHNFCADCFKEHCITATGDWLTVIQTKCPQMGCNLVIPEDLFLKLVPAKEAAVFRKSQLKNFTESNDEMHICPYPTCNQIVQIFISIGEIQCMCNQNWCVKCKKTSHRPVSCEMFSNWEFRSKDSSNVDKWMEANCKTCFNCGQKIQKSSGCNYMLCDKRAGGCGEAFCYVCEVNWKEHSQDHFKCNKYTEEVKQKEQEAEKIKAEVAKYEFYYNRFMNYKASVRSIPSLKVIVDKRVESFMARHKNDYSEYQFLYDLLKLMAKAKTILSYTYTFGFYIESLKKELFEHQQGIFEKNVETLHKIIEFDFAEDLDEIESTTVFFSNFYAIREKTLNLGSSTEKYSENIVEMIENEMINDVNFAMFNQ